MGQYRFSRRGSLALALLAAAGFAGTAQAADIPKSPEVAETGKLTIANTLEYAPFEFIDAEGNTIATAVIQDTFDTPIPVGESFSETAECNSNSKIKGVYVSEYVPEG